MRREDFFDPDPINFENIKALSMEQAIIFEKRICEISEIVDNAVLFASDFLKMGFGIYEILELISEGIDAQAISEYPFALDENISKIKLCIESLSLYDKAMFAAIFTQRLKKQGINVNESDFLFDKSGDESVIYVKNRLSDEAYDVFADQLGNNSTVAYAETFKSAAMAVAEGKKEYCILPLEERGGSRIASIAALLFTYDLKISSVTPVFGYDGSADVKYALVSKHFSIPLVAVGDDRYLEIRMRIDGSISLSALLSASDMLGVSLYRINTIRFDTEDGEIPSYVIVFKSEECDFSALLVFLTLFAGSYTAIGIYKNLE